MATAFPRHDEDLITPWLGDVLLELRRRGVDARVLAPSYRGGGATDWRGVPVRRFRYAPARLETLTHDETAPDRLRRRPWYGALLPGYLIGGALAALETGAAGAEVVHVHWPVPHALFGAVARLASGGRAAVVSSFYSVELNWIERRLRPALPLLRWSIETADVVTAISTSTAAAIGRHDAGRPVRVIPFAAAGAGERGRPGPRATVGGEGAAPGRAAPRAGGDPDSVRELRMLFVGRLVERKGVEVAVRALAQVRRSIDARFVIVGSGSSESRIRAVISETGVEGAVELTGPVSAAELTARYREADVFVLPAVVDAKGDTEGLGVVLLEALRAGLPVIASAAGGIPDIVRHGDTGWLVPPGDSAALARTILDVARDPAEAAARVERGRALIERSFSLPGIVDRLLDCYADAIAARGTTRPRTDP